MTAQQTLTLRHATAADQPALRELAELDSTHLPAGPFLVAELDGRPGAALSLADGMAVADPFVPTAELVDLLRAHGSARASLKRRRRTRSARRLRPALSV